MRIVTWNLERGHHGGECVLEQQHVLAGHPADIVVLTEVPTSMSTQRNGTVCSSPRRQGRLGMEAWVSISAEGCRPVGPDLPFERMAVAVEVIVDDDPFLIYGSVLPWSNAIHHASYLAKDGESAPELFDRMLRDQVNDMAGLRRHCPDHTLIWAGDFNQTLSGPYGGSKRGRQHLTHALAELDLVAWNHESAHSKPPMHAIDLICGPHRRTPPRRVETFKPVLDGRTLSDHAGYLIEIYR